MNTICVHLNERLLADLNELMDEGLDTISSKLSSREAEHYTQADRDEIMRLCCEGISEIRQALEDRSYLWTSGTGNISLEIPAQAVEDIARQGDNEPAVKRWLGEPSYLKAQFDRWDQDDIDAARAYMSDSGLDDVYEKLEEEVMHFLLWMACHDIKEEMAND